MILSSHEIAKLAFDQGFSEEEAIKIVSIILATSGGDTEFLNRELVMPEEQDQLHGLAGISSRQHSDQLRMGNWRDPVDNMRMAKSIFDSPGGFLNFSAFIDKSWKKFEVLAHFGVETPVKPPFDIPNTLNELLEETSTNAGQLDLVVNYGIKAQEAIDAANVFLAEIAREVEKTSGHFAS